MDITEVEENLFAASDAKVCRMANLQARIGFKSPHFIFSFIKRNRSICRGFSSFPFARGILLLKRLTSFS